MRFSEVYAVYAVYAVYGGLCSLVSPVFKSFKKLNFNVKCDSISLRAAYFMVTQKKWKKSRQKGSTETIQILGFDHTDIS